MNLLKPNKPKIIKDCPRWKAGYDCRIWRGSTHCPDCGRGIQV